MRNPKLNWLIPYDPTPVVAIINATYNLFSNTSMQVINYAVNPIQNNVIPSLAALPPLHSYSPLRIDDEQVVILKSWGSLLIAVSGVLGFSSGPAHRSKSCRIRHCDESKDAE